MKMLNIKSRYVYVGMLNNFFEANDGLQVYADLGSRLQQILLQRGARMRCYCENFTRKQPA